LRAVAWAVRHRKCHGQSERCCGQESDFHSGLLASVWCIDTTILAVFAARVCSRLAFVRRENARKLRGNA
jgi:hypothetical protein